MIITKQKNFNEILKFLNDDPVFIAGCSKCATLCHTGGEKEVLTMKKALEDKSIKVVGWVVLDPACHLNNDKRLIREHQHEVDITKKILVLACGNGVQVISEILDDKNVISGTDALFLGEIKRANEFEKRCIMCGDCIVDQFAGLCPVSRCPKHMLNGPCGGAVDGKCEVDPNLDCIWDAIYKRLRKKGQLHLLKTIQEPKDWSKSTIMQMTV